MANGDDISVNLGQGQNLNIVTRAVVDGDIIVRLVGGETSIGPVPKGIGLERLRFDGSKVVDLMTVTEMWVEQKAGAFVLHCIPLPGCRRVAMTYSDRNRITADGDGFRLLTDEEISDAAARAAEKSKNEALIRWIMQKTEGAILLDLIRLLYALILAEREPNAQLGAWLNTQLADMKATFEWSSAERIRLERLIDALKEKMGEFYA